MSDKKKTLKNDIQMKFQRAVLDGNSRLLTDAVYDLRAAKKSLSDHQFIGLQKSCGTVVHTALDRIQNHPRIVAHVLHAVKEFSHLFLQISPELIATTIINLGADRENPLDAPPHVHIFRIAQAIAELRGGEKHRAQFSESIQKLDGDLRQKVIDYAQDKGTRAELMLLTGATGQGTDPVPVPQAPHHS